MIGNLADAMVAYDLGKRNARTNLPTGWRYLGTGSSRTAYVKDGVVYKYWHSEGWHDYNCNEVEFRYVWWLKGQDYPEEFVTPTTWYFPEVKVVAMEYVEHDPRLTRQNVDCWSTGAWDALGQNDVGSHNCAWLDGMIVLFDLGYVDEDIQELLPDTLDILG